MEVAITGVGAINALAPSFDAFSAAACAGPGFSPWPAEVHPPSPSAVAGLVRAVDRDRYMSPSDRRSADKVTAMGVLAAGQALESAGLWVDGRTTISGDAVATLVGTSRPEYGGIAKFSQPILRGGASGRLNPMLFPYMARSIACGQICITFRLRGYSTNLAAGPLSGLQAVARAWDLLSSGRADVALVGGVESLSRISLRITSEEIASGPSAEGPSFFGGGNGLRVPAEGATFLVLETLEHARARDRTPLTYVTGVETGRFRRDASARDCVEALENKILPSLGLGWREIGVVSSGAAGAGEAHDRLETRMLEGVAARNDYWPPVTACRSLTGDAEAASSALQAAVAVQALSGRTIAPTVNADLASSLNVARKPAACERHGGLVTAFDKSGSYVFLGLSSNTPAAKRDGSE